MTSLSFLSLTDLLLTKPPSLSLIKSTLEVLHLSRNRLNHIPDQYFEGLERLEHLELTGNDLTSVPLDGLNGISAIYLNCNELSTMPDFGKISTNIQYIFVNDNNIAECGALCTTEYPMLNVANVEGNRLQSFPVDELLANSPRIHQLILSDNPLRTMPTLKRSFNPEECEA